MKNPVVFALIIHVVVLVAILAGVMTVVRSLDRNLVLVILVTVAPATIIVIISLGSTIAVITQRARHRLVVSRNPRATVIPAEWSSAVLAPFVKETDASGSNYRGFGVEITADESGLGFWRSRTMNDVILIGRLPWSQIDAVEAGSVKAVIGRRVAPTIRIAVRPGSSSPFTEEIELLLRKVSVQRALAALRPGDR